MCVTTPATRMAPEQHHDCSAASCQCKREALEIEQVPRMVAPSLSASRSDERGRGASISCVDVQYWPLRKGGPYSRMKKVMIAEDDLLVLADMLEEVLKTARYEVCGIARTVNEGIEICEAAQA